MSDIELWQAWRERGDAEAFTTLVERYLDMVYATARRILGNAHDAEDVAQDCFITLLKGRVKVQDPLGPWLHRVARNRALDRIKGETRRRDRERAWHDTNTQPGEPDIDDILQHVDDAIDALPADLRAAIVGRFLEGKTNRALGEAWGVGESTIRLRVNNGVAKIRETLGKRGIMMTAAALGALLENNLTSAAPTALRQALNKRALATPPPGPAPRGLPSPRFVAGLAVGLMFFLIGGYSVVSNDFQRLLDRAGLSPQPRAEVTMTTHPIPATETPAPPATTPTATATTAITALPVQAEAPPAPEPEEPTSTVSGTIYDERGYPLPGAIVTVASRGDTYSVEDMQTFTATTGADGSYSVDGIRHQKSFWGYTTTHRPGKEPEFSGLIRLDPPTLYPFVRVGVSAEGYLTTGEQAVGIEPGTHKKDVDFTLAPGTTMRGRVVWPDGSPVGNAGIINVFVRDAQYRWVRSAIDLCSTDQDGNFLLGLEKPGVVSLIVAAADGRASVFPEVPANSEEIPALTMTPVAALSGAVVTSDGQPLAAARVTVSGRFGLVDEPDFSRQVESSNASEICSAYIQATYTDPDGSFTFPTLAAVPDAVLTIWAPQQEGKNTSQRLLSHHVGPLPPGQETVLDIVLPGAGEVMTLAVSVVGETSGEPLPFTGVSVLHHESQRSHPMSPDLDPPFYPVKQELTAPGAYLVWPTYNNRDLGKEQAAYGQEVTWKAGSTRSITFRIPDPFALSVQVVDSEGNPLPGAKVECFTVDSNRRTENVDAGGRASFGGFAPNAPGWFQATKDGYLPDETVAITGEPCVDYPEQTIMLHPTGGLEGQLVDADGLPIANTAVYPKFSADAATWLQRQESTNQVSTNLETDGEGAFVWLDGVPAVPGTVTVSVYESPDRRFRSAPKPVAITPGAVLQLDTLVLESVDETKVDAPVTTPK